MAAPDVVVVGAGMAGASAAWALSERLRVVLVEREAQPGLHATGRSASVLSETSGDPVVCALARASRSFLADPPSGFADYPLLSPRGLLWIGTADDGTVLDALARQGQSVAPTVRRIDGEAAGALVAALRPERLAAGGVYEPDAMAIDVDGLLQGFLRGFTRRGGTVLSTAEAVSCVRQGAGWRVVAGSHRLDCAVVVDAAGAWGDELAGRGCIAPVGLRPLRRTAAIVPAPDEVRTWPLVMDVASRFYFEPEAGGLLVSPADETPSEACDARPEEADVALGLDALNEATTLGVRSVRRTWAGLRTFSPDRVPVVGFEPGVPGFCWLVGQGGAGIKTAPALAAVVAALVAGEPLPGDVAALGVTADALTPSRFR